MTDRLPPATEPPPTPPLPDGTPTGTAPCGAHPITEDCCCLCHEAGRADERCRWEKRITAIHAVLMGTANATDGDHSAAATATRRTLRTVAQQLADLLDGDTDG